MSTVYDTAEEIPYDEDLPFAVWRIKGDPINSAFPAGVVEVRFRMAFEAKAYVDEYGPGWVEMVDTTPKPRIPEDTEFIAWRRGGGTNVAVLENFNPNKPWDWWGQYFSEEELLTEIGDSEIIVLDRREEE